MSIPNRTAFLTSDPREIPDLLKIAPPIFRIYLIGEHNYKHPKVTVINTEKLTFNFRERRYYRILECLIGDDMAKRGLIDINCGRKEEPLIKGILEYLESSNDVVLNGHPYVLENILYNLSQAEYFVDFLENKFKDKPCILVGSGPSINKNIHVLKGLTDRALIIACGSGLGKLIENNIKPHFLTILDPYQRMYDAVGPYIPKTSDKTVLINALEGNHQITQEFKGTKLFCITELDHLNYIENVKAFSASQSVTGLSLALAEFMGCNPIIFMGQDLTPPKYSGIAEFLRLYISTSQTLKNYTKFINATEGGAGIVGASHISLQETAERYLTKDFQFQLSELPPKMKQSHDIEGIKKAYQQRYDKWLAYSKL